MSLSALLGSLEIVVGFGAAAFVGGRISAWATGPSDGLAERLLVWVLVTTAQLVAVLTVCGMLVVLYAPVVLGVNVVVAVGVARWLPPPGPKPAKWIRLGLERSILCGVLTYAGVLAVLLCTRTRSTALDGEQYHMPNAASWIQIHDIWHMPPVDPGYFTNGYPSNGELLMSWVMQPVHGTQLAAFPTLIFGLILLLAGAVLGRQLGGTALGGLLGATTIVLASVSWRSEVGQVNTDWAATAGLVAAAALVLRGRSGEQKRWMLLAGVGLGLSVGSKDTALAPAVCVVIFALVVTRREAVWRSVGLLISAAMALAGVWFLRDAIQTGNPLYPEPVGIGGRVLLPGGESPLTRYSASLLKDLVSNRGGLRIWLHWMRVFVGLPALVCLAEVWVLVTRRTDRATVATIALSVAWFLAYIATPYTGPANASFLIASQIRYALPAMVLSAVCAAATIRWVQALAWIAIGWCTVGLGRPFAPLPQDVPPGTYVVISAGVGGLATLVLWRRSRLAGALPVPTGREATGLVTTVVGLFAVVAATVVVVHRAPKPTLIDAVYAEVARDAPASGWAHRPVAMIGVADVISLMGPTFDHRVVGLGTGPAGQRPITSAAGLDERLTQIKPVAVVLDKNPEVPGYVAGWEPPGYRFAGLEGPDPVYVVDSGV